MFSIIERLGVKCVTIHPQVRAVRLGRVAGSSVNDYGLASGREMRELLSRPAKWSLRVAYFISCLFQRVSRSPSLSLSLVNWRDLSAQRRVGR
jgi:hypothetical protein